MDIWSIFKQYYAFYYNYTTDLLLNPSWTNPFYWVLFWVLICFVLEQVLPKKMSYNNIKRKGFWLDLFYVLLYDFVFIIFGFLAVTALVELLYLNSLKAMGIEPIKLLNISNWPTWLQILVLFVVTDFVEYVAHYSMHRFNFLWAFHKVHHAQEEIGFASSRHFHWGEYLIGKPLHYLPLSILGYSAEQFIYVSLIIFLFEAFFTHTNVKLPFGPFNYVINNPQTHFWHHAKNYPNKFKYGVNFSSVLNIWDVIFGVYYNPKNKEPKLGVHDSDANVPAGFFGQLMYPIKHWQAMFSKKKR